MENLPNEPQIDSNDDTSGCSDILEKRRPIAQSGSGNNNNDRILRIGLVGCGRRGQKFLKAIEALPDLKLVAICDVLDFSADDIPVFKSIDELVKIPFDIGIVCVPHNEHVVICRTLMEHGVHVLKEKPFAPSLEEAEELVRLANKHNVQLMISTQRRFSPAYMKCKTMIVDGVLGSISCIDVRHTLKVDQPKTGNWRREASADVLLDLGYHMLDIITWLFGVPEEIHVRRNERNHYENAEAADMGIVTFRKVFEDGKAAIGSIFLAPFYHKNEEYLTIIGTNGSIVIEDGEKLEHLDLDREPIPEEPLHGDPLQSVLQHFAEAIRGRDGQSHPNNSVDPIETMKFVNALQNYVES
jgi:predicted dehydrogenase